MGLLDKLKNVFFEEEYIEVEEKNEPKEKVTVAKKIETPEIRKKEESVAEELKINIEEKEKEPIEVKEEKDFKFPMSFDDKDFEVEKTMEIERPIREKEDHHIVEEIKEEPPVIELRETREYRYEEPVNTTQNNNTELYSHRPYEGSKEKDDKQGFKPSPIISPIYGILNKNYKKEEIVTKKEVRLSQATTKKADLDLVREKAYGDLAGEISASIEEDVKEEPPKEEKEDLLYDLNEDESPTVKVVTVGDAEEYFNDLGLEYNVDYKVEKEEKKDESRPVIKEDNKINIEEPNEDDKNLFDLIDSMYEDKE